MLADSSEHGGGHMSRAVLGEDVTSASDGNEVKRKELSTFTALQE
jgi:hypothetical protein